MSHTAHRQSKPTTTAEGEDGTAFGAHLTPFGVEWLPTRAGGGGGRVPGRGWWRG